MTSFRLQVKDMKIFSLKKKKKKKTMVECGGYLKVCKVKNNG